MAAESLFLTSFVGAALCWAALATPELPAFRRGFASRLAGWLRVERVAAELAQAGLRQLSPWQWIATRWAASAAAGAAGVVLFGLPVIGAVAALAIYHATAVALEARRRRVETGRQRALLDAVRFGVNVMSRSGGALHMLRALAENGPIDARRIFSDILVDAGSDLPDLLVGAVERTRTRLADPLFDDIALALTLHWVHGGRLAPALDSLVVSWEATIRLQREARALRAGVEASISVLTALPFVLLVTVHMLAPALLAPLAQPAGEAVLALAVAWMVIGHRVLQRLSEAPRQERVAVEGVIP